MESIEPTADFAPPPAAAVRELVERALAEDLGHGDVTTVAFIAASARARARLCARKPGVVAGLGVAAATFSALAADIATECRVHDGDAIEAGAVLLTVAGPARALLSAERVALNFVQRLSGIATLTARYVHAVEGTTARIADTRKTTPGLRLLERYAVRCGGGHNHRYNLSEAVLLKDNHRHVLATARTPLAEAVRSARRRLPHVICVEIEVDSLDELDAALAAEPDAVLLDNMGPTDVAEAVRRTAGRALIEASGAITLDTVRAVAVAGADVISVGALTHSAPALDMSLDFMD